MTPLTTIALATNFFLVLLALKTIVGYRFPWETCSCCGKKIREHK